MPKYKCCNKVQSTPLCGWCGLPMGPDKSLSGLRDHLAKEVVALNKAIDDLSSIPTSDGTPLLEPDEKAAKKIKARTAERDQRVAWVGQLDDVLAELELEAEDAAGSNGDSVVGSIGAERA